MPIQFNCLTCGKPIEVDDEFAGQAVTCPYCRKVMNAPTSGTAPAGPPESLPDSGPPPASAPLSPAFAPPQVQRSNWFASVSLACSIIVMLCFCVALAGSYKVMKQIAPDLKLKPDQMEEYVDRTSKEPLLMVSSIVTLSASVTGVIFAILGLTRRTGRRWQAIVGLVICGLMLACGCLTIVMNLASMATGKGH